MSREENQLLLQKLGQEEGPIQVAKTTRGDNFETSGFKKKVIIALMLACLAFVALISHDPAIGGLQATALSFFPNRTTSTVVNTNPIEKGLETQQGAGDGIYCDDQGNGECINRILGVCTEHGPCVAVPTREPTGTPTSLPSNIYLENNCDPHNPPCSEWFLGICIRRYHCNKAEEPCGDSEDVDYAVHRSEECDPNNPPCAPGENFMGICRKFQVCGDSDSSKGKISDGERGDKTSHFEVDKSSRHRPIVTTPNQNEPWDKNVTSPVNKVSANGSTSASPKTRKYNNLNATLPVKDDRGENGPNVNESRANGKKENLTITDENEPRVDTSTGSNGTKSEDQGVGHVSAEDLNGDDFFDFKWMNLNITIPFIGALTSVPTMEPTQIHACDPQNPPCARYEVGVCVEYQVCFGIHSTPHNTTQEQFNDDEGYTFEPTHMPVPDPTYRPSEFPTSTPTTTVPTLAGFTFEPTVTMMPTVAETFHPTRLLYCDPQNPPCDSYFFGVCLGIRYCMGTHEPTPSPTMVALRT